MNRQQKHNADRMFRRNVDRAQERGDWVDMARAEDRHNLALNNVNNRGAPLVNREGNRGAPLVPRGGPRRQRPEGRNDNRNAADGVPPPVRRAPRETAPRDDPMFAGLQLGGVSMQANYCRNMEYSGFTSLISATYEGFRRVDATVDRALPFPIFQHTCASALNAKIISHGKIVNHDNRFNGFEDPTAYFEQTKFPAPITNYLAKINGTSTAGGENVRLNIPTPIVPVGPIIEGDGVVAMKAGSFGVVAALDHNKYECAMAPLVTAGLIIENANLLIIKKKKTRFIFYLNFFLSSVKMSTIFLY